MWLATHSPATSRTFCAHHLTFIVILWVLFLLPFYRWAHGDSAWLITSLVSVRTRTRTRTSHISNPHTNKWGLSREASRIWEDKNDEMRGSRGGRPLAWLLSMLSFPLLVEGCLFYYLTLRSKHHRDPCLPWPCIQCTPMYIPMDTLGWIPFFFKNSVSTSGVLFLIASFSCVLTSFLLSLGSLEHWCCRERGASDTM